MDSVRKWQEQLPVSVNGAGRGSSSTSAATAVPARPAMPGSVSSESSAASIPTPTISQKDPFERRASRPAKISNDDDKPPLVPTLRNLRGKWKLSRAASDDFSPILAVQGYSAPIRKAVALAPVFLDCFYAYDSKQDETVSDEAALLYIRQHTTGGLLAIKEVWHHDGIEREQKDSFLGRMRVKSEWKRAGDFSAEEEYFVRDLPADENVIDATVFSIDKGWTARHVWHVDQQGRFVRRVRTTKGDQSATAITIHERRDLVGEDR